MPQAPPRIAYLTAGAAGMYCGSCMHDNTLVAALHKLGVDVQLVPTYTPIRTDEDNVSVDYVAFGGINIFLQERFALFRRLPNWMDRIFDRPWLINWLANRSFATDTAQLGALTVSMLQGRHGHQQKEVAKLVAWLTSHGRPELIVLSNMLIAGCVPALKEALGAPAIVTLQGDDIFLESLPEPHKSRALEEIARLVPQVDGFVVNSRYYADYMSQYMSIPRDMFRIVPLGIDTAGFEYHGPPAPRPPTIGYLARLAPEKGLHQLVDAFLLLREAGEIPDARLRIAGWLGESNRAYAEEQFDRLHKAGLDDAFEYVGSVDRAGKLAFLREIDVLSVPTVYHEPKGLFVLEALAAGVPVVQPEHGAFPELLAETGGGRLVRPGDAEHLAAALSDLLADADGRAKLGAKGREAVHARFNALTTAQAVLEVYQSLLSPARLT